MTEAQLAAAERDLERAASPVPRWLRPVPFAAGALVAGGLLVAERYEGAEDESMLVFGFYANLAMALVMTYASSTPLEQYHSLLGHAQLDVRVTPTSSGAVLGIQGTF